MMRRRAAISRLSQRAKRTSQSLNRRRPQSVRPKKANCGFFPLATLARERRTLRPGFGTRDKKSDCKPNRPAASGEVGTLLANSPSKRTPIKLNTALNERPERGISPPRAPQPAGPPCFQRRGPVFIQAQLSLEREERRHGGPMPEYGRAQQTRERNDQRNGMGFLQASSRVPLRRVARRAR
jgi:hypothetical protein